MSHCYQDSGEYPFGKKGYETFDMDISENYKLLSDDFKQMIDEV